MVLTMTSFIPVIPVAVIALIIWALHRYASADVWQLLLGAVLGVVLSGTILGPDIHTILSQLSGGHLH